MAENINTLSMKSSSAPRKREIQVLALRGGLKLLPKNSVLSKKSSPVRPVLISTFSFSQMLLIPKSTKLHKDVYTS